MNDEINYKNNPLHGLGLKKLLNEIVDQYGFELLDAYLNINCFKTNPSIESSVKFLKKTEWAREKVEAFYLYQFKNLPKASDDQYELAPRDRIVPEHQEPGEPAELSLEDAERLREKRAQKAAEHNRGGSRSRPRQDRGYSSGRGKSSNPWGNARPQSSAESPYRSTKSSPYGGSGSSRDDSESRSDDASGVWPASDDASSSAPSKSGDTDPWGNLKK